ncbi:MFS transporter [Herbidospora daliensis]|uniref:MFS transporter n=1 Tax=Herbidospora daliensis TaxID=295585 RepID=UPI000781B100|nr:MFS transporter [Herbidospora daliensis]
MDSRRGRSRYVFAAAWTGSFSSMLASRMFGVTYPLLALAILGSATQASWIGFAWALPHVLFYVLAGALVDRWDYRAIILIADTARAIAMVSLGAALLFTELTFIHLMVVAFVEGALSVFHSLAVTAALPSIARTLQAANPARHSNLGLSDARLHKGVSLHETGAQVAVFLGRPLGGFLFGLSQWVPFLAGAVLFGFSLLVTRSLPRDNRLRISDRRNLTAEIIEGYRKLVAFKPLWAATVVIVFTNVAFHALIWIFYSAMGEQVSPLVIGLVVALTGMGGLTASAFHRPVQAYFRTLFGVPEDRMPRYRLLRAPVFSCSARATRPPFGVSQVSSVSSTRDISSMWSDSSAQDFMAPRKRRNAPKVSMMLFHAWCWVAALALLWIFGQNIYTFIGALTIMGAAGGLSNVYVRLLIHEHIAPDVVGRVVSVSRLLGYGGIAVGPLVGGLLISCGGEEFAVELLLGFVGAVALLGTAVPGWRRAFFVPKPDDLNRAAIESADPLPETDQRVNDVQPSEGTFTTVSGRPARDMDT